MTLFQSSICHLTKSDLPAISKEPKGWRVVFGGRKGIRAGWRLLMFIAGFALLNGIFRFVLDRIPACAEMLRTIVLTPGNITLEAATGIVALFIPAIFMSRLEKIPWRAYGVPFQNVHSKLFWQGVLTGLVFETLIISAIAAFGGFSVIAVALSPGVFLRYACLWSFGFMLIAVQEEFRFRGYLQFTLASGVGFWPSAALLSILSGFANRGPGATWVGIAEGTIFGLFAALTLRRTGNLWFAIGFRAGLDFGESFIYAVPDSGFLPTHSFLTSALHGPRWLTGGAPGPQESAITFGMLLAVIALFGWLSRGTPAAPAA